jgi:hypothetical protein
METAIQLSVFLENQPGTLARVCDELARNEINILAMTVANTIDHAIVRLVVDRPHKALDIFEERGTPCDDNEVILLQGDNRPGSLAEIAHKLANADVNIHYAYLATPSGESRGLLVLRTDDIPRTMKALGEDSAG